MRDVCDLCGAKLYEGEPACRDCGAPRAGVVAKPLPEEDSEVAARYDLEGDTLLEDLEAIPPMPQSFDAQSDPDLAPDPVSEPELPGAGLAAVPALHGSALPGEPGAPVSSFGDGVDDVSLGFESDEVPGRSGPKVAAVVIGLALVGGGGAYALRGAAAAVEDDRAPTTDEAVSTPPATPPKPVEPAAECAGADALAGTWGFTTEVTTALSVARLGIRGFYELDIAVNGCEVVADLRKLGYTGRTYKDRQIRRATASLDKVADGPPRFSGLFALRSRAGKGDDIEIRLSVDGDALAGTYRHRGEAWSSTGISGFLLGERPPSGRRLLPNLVDEPCWARCSVSCAASRRDDDPALEPLLASCEKTCTAEPEGTHRCPEASVLPAELAIQFTGPKPRLRQLCKALGVGGKKDTCRREPPVVVGGKKVVTPSLDEQDVDGGFSAVHVLETKPRRKGARLYRLAIQTKSGWFVSEGILPPDASLDDVGLFARDLGEGERRYVAGFATAGPSARLFVCRVLDGTPKCGLVEPKNGQLAVPLPGGALALISETGNPIFGLD